MGQVPKSQKILIIGNGRVAKHWSHYLSLLKIPHFTWNRQSNVSLPDCDIVFLAINDTSIPNFLQSQPSLQNKICIHFSGALSFDGILGIHPLMTFSETLYDIKTYQEIPLAIDFSDSLYAEILHFLPNPHWYISPSQKAKYHALCVMSGNFPQVLWQYIEKEMQDLGCPIPAWKTYLLQSTTNFIKNSNSITGPLIRNDSATIQKNIQSLEGNPLQSIYHSFCQFYNLSSSEVNK